MKNAILLLAAICLTFSGLKSQDLEEVLQSHYEAVGQEAMKEVKSMKSKGKSAASGMEMPFVTFHQRPDKMRIEVELMGSMMVQAYDGTTGWMIAPWTGSTEPIEISGFELDNLKIQSDFDGMLYNYEEKGYTTVLVGKEEMEGSEVFKIRQTDQRGNVFDHYLEAENFVMLKTAAKLLIDGSEVESETFYSNYKTFHGIVSPCSIESRVGGQTVSQVTIEDIEFNVEIEDGIFMMPGKE